ncbi:unnamed protein product [Adineta ricciae]|uniref:Uncharacterized protein n=1 Tax=Adineta ricciae TaxID=249248 RepID=A0A814G0B6_ADIRI|nr:unnamed protein product [Adineta ricciae]CAF1021219.1 unnamed protein product [Adineta ricciae]
MTSSTSQTGNHTTTNTVDDEKFEETHSPDQYAIQVVNDGRVCEKLRHGAYGCALGNNSYSSGIHQIKVKIHFGNVFLGIRSRNIVPIPLHPQVPKYDDTPSTYGWWIKSGFRRCNGNSEASNLPGNAEDNSVFILTINCEEYRLAIVNEKSKVKDEMEVDRLHAPFPWCLFVELPRTLSCVSLV